MKKYLFYLSILLIVISIISFVNSAIFISPLKPYRPDWFDYIAIQCFFISLYTLPLQLGLGIYFTIYNQYRKIGILLLICLMLTLVLMSLIKEI